MGAGGVVTEKLLLPTAFVTRQMVWVGVRAAGGVEVWFASAGLEARWAEVIFGILCLRFAWLDNVV